jgi:hypothetical protein
VKRIFSFEGGTLMSQVIVLTVAAGLVGILWKWGRRDHRSAVQELMAAKVKTAAKKVERSAASVEAALEALVATVADEQRVGLSSKR